MYWVTTEYLLSQASDKAVNKTVITAVSSWALEVRKWNAVLTSYYICIVRLWKWKKRISGIFAQVRLSLQNAQISYLHLSPCEGKKKKKFCFVFLWLALFLRVHSNYNLLKASKIFSRKRSIKKKKQNTVVALILEGSSTPLRFHKRGN